MNREKQPMSRNGSAKPPKLFVIGLDCAAPDLVFRRWKNDLPNLTSLASQGTWGELQSCIPAITVPAWSCMLSGRDPGEMGIYGFRNRRDRTYENMSIATGNAVRVRRVWDYLSEAGKQCVVVGVPQTYPVRPLNGLLISDFLTPGIESEFTYPPELKREILSLVPDYEFDVHNFRTDDKDWLLRQIQVMTEKRFVVIDHLLKTKPWDFFMIVEIGVDRIHHGFWSYHDPEHRRYIPGNRFENAIHDYYVEIDRKIGEWLEAMPPETHVLVVSDHGAKRMDGGICLNQWLWEEGYLAFKDEPASGNPVPLEKLKVDWTRTRAWGSGGYYGRVFLNVKGREPDGTIDQGDLRAVRDELAERLSTIPDHQGRDIQTRVFKPEEIYRSVNGVAPDLLVYFGDLLWRAVGSIGHGALQTFENDTGPDDCNHAENGMFIWCNPHVAGPGHEASGARLPDIASTILDLFSIPIPPEMQGRSFLGG